MRDLALTLLHVVALTLGGASCQAGGASNAALRSERVPDTVPVKVEFERTGGFAGMRLHLTLDSDTLAAGQARELRRLIADARFFSLPARIADSTPAAGPDRFQYTVTLESAGRRHSVRVAEDAAPVSLRPLLAWLTRMARAVRHPG